MYELISKNSNFKKKFLYYASYDDIDVREEACFFKPNIRRFYVRGQHITHIGHTPYLVLLGKEFDTAIELDKIPTNGTFSVPITNYAIISTSKQDIARFFRKKIVEEIKTLQYRYQNTTQYGYINSRKRKYKKCIDILKTLK